MILTSFAEVITIGAVLPFLSVLTSPEFVFEHQITKPFIEYFKIMEPKQLFLPITVLFAIAALLSGLMRVVLLWAQTRLSYNIGADFSISIYRRTLYQPYSVHTSRNSSEVIAGTGKASTVVSFIILPIITIISSSILLLSILIALFYIDPVVALATFGGFGAIYIFVIIISKKQLAKDSKCINRESIHVLKALQEGLGGIRDVLIDGTQSTYCNIYRNSELPLRRASANIQIISGSPRYVIEALGMLLIAALAYSFTHRAEGITNSIPILGALALGAQRLLPVLQQSYSSWTSMRGGHATLSDALDLLDQPLPENIDAPLPPALPFEHNISLSKLGYRYSLQTPWILRKFNLTITKGSRIGFIGATGSGKSTLIDIIMGLLNPTEGNLEVDGINITSKNQRAWQSHIAHVPQAIFLADTTIAENIAFGVPIEQIDYDRLHQAAQKAQIANVIEGLENQYATIVGERGVRFSGGQRQRIGIARALYKQANVIVFDEATSALDNDTELAVMQSIESLSDELTVIIVAHRLSSLKNCTQVIELSDGKVKRSGTFKEIIGDTV